MTTTPNVHVRSLRVRMLALSIAFAVAMLGLSRLLGAFAGFSVGLGWTAVAAFLLAMSVAAVGIRAFHPFSSLGPANWVTTTRTALVAMIVGLLVQPVNDAVASTAVVIATIAAVLDGWDGWLARRTRMESVFGARFDMEIDALLILILGIFVWRYQKAGVWILLSGALRYAFVIAGVALGWFRRALPPSTRRKTVCVIQIVALIVAISPIIGQPLSVLVSGVSLAALVWSFGVDVRWLWRAREVETARSG